jgi:hypothetical protein
MMSPFLAAAQHAPQMMDRYGGPVGLAGRAIGLSVEGETKLPWWAWLGVGAIVGGVGFHILLKLKG